MSEFAYKGKRETGKTERKREKGWIEMGRRAEDVSYLTCMAGLERLSVRGYEGMNGVDESTKQRKRINETTCQRINERAN